MWEPSPEELKALKERHAKDATDAEFTLWITECQQRDLRPVTDLILMPRTVSVYNKAVRGYEYVKQFTIMTSINALRRLAERTGKYGGPLKSEFIYLENGKPTLVSDIPLPDPKDLSQWLEPWTVRAYIKRKDFDEPTVGIARWGAYVQTVKKNDKYRLNSVWKNRGPEQLEKCAKAQALREAFPEELGGLYTQEEFRDDHPDEEQQQQQPEQSAPPPPVANTPKVNQAPAEAQIKARPGEKPEAPKEKAAEETPNKESKKSGGRRKKKEEPPTPPDKPEEDPMEAPLPEQADPEPPGKGAEDVAEPEDKKDKEVPTKDEQRAIRKKMGSYDVETLKIGHFIKNFTNKNQADQVTRGEWKRAFKKLDKVKKLGNAAFNSLLEEAERKLEEK